MGNIKSIKRGKTEVYVANDVFELCDILDLTPQDAIEIEFRAKLKDKIKDVVRSKNLTHEQAAKLFGTSRTKSDRNTQWKHFRRVQRPLAENTLFARLSDQNIFQSG